MIKPRYVVLCPEGAWLIKRAGHHFSGSYASKAAALCAAIGYAERDGDSGCISEVLVRHEDDHFVTEWVYGRDPVPDEAARPDRASARRG